MAWSWDKSMSFPTFKFDFDQLGTWGFWKRWLIEFLGSTLFAMTAGALSGSIGNAWGWGFSYLVWSSVMGATIFTPITFSETMSNSNFIQGVMHCLAQGLACNLAACADFQAWFGFGGFKGAEAMEFKSLFGSAAVFEFVTIFVYFFFVTKGCDDGIPAWLFTTMMIAGAFWLNTNAIFTPSRIWVTNKNTWGGVFGTYLNNFMGVYFGVNCSNYLFAGKMDRMMGK